jgi:hypothetical protein
MIPKSILGRVLASIWLSACVALLIFAFKQKHIHDMPEAFLLLLIMLSFPIGYVASALVGLLWAGISAMLGLSYHPFADLIPVWVVVVSLGYCQWFIALPWLVRRFRRSRLGA